MLSTKSENIISMQIEYLCNRTCRFLAKHVPSFARLSLDEQDIWVASALSDMEEFELTHEDALPEIALAKWMLSIPRISADAELASVLRAKVLTENQRLHALTRCVVARLHAGATAEK